MERPFAESAEQNRGPILQVLRTRFSEPGTVLEIGSGTGQHAVHFARALPHLQWQPSDVAAHLAGIEAWSRDAALVNLRPARLLDVAGDPWPDEEFEYAYTANTAHIMHWPEVLAMLAGIGWVLRPGGLFAMYGPFAVGGRHTAPSNAAFDAMLRRSDPGMGVRDIDELMQAAGPCGLELEARVQMPVNNLMLIWQRTRP